jgi:cell division protein FtsZ
MAAPVIEVREEPKTPAVEVVDRLPEGDGRPFPYGHRPEDWVLTSAVPPPPVAPVEPELVPVPRSVFDDDFFKTGRIAPATPSVADTRMPSARGFETPDGVRPVRMQSEPEPAAFVPAEPVVRPFGGTHGAQESDELDIPAFLRRGN